ncbi:MAG: polysulfide reductase NrfD [Acidobacteriota bacterium]|jgi:formate-dependent nitrite reductase membrane component NrfD
MPEPRWGWLIVLYLFLGGLSAGLFFISALATYLQRGDGTAFPRLARAGALLAPWPVSLGSALLVFDLGHWYRFYKLFVSFEWRSPMSIGAWLLLLFTGITLLSFWAWLPADRLGAALARLPRRLRFLRGLERPWREGLRRPLAMVGFPVAVGVGIYTGVLLGAVQARPFWNTNLVAQMFLFSALSTGCALLILVLSLRRSGLEADEARLLFSLDIVLIVLELFVVLPYIIHGALSPLAVQEALRLILGGPFTWAFWGWFFTLGLLLPLGLELWEMRPVLLARQELHPGRGMAPVAAVLVLFGGLMLRYVFVFAGQVSTFR